VISALRKDVQAEEFSCPRYQPGPRSLLPGRGHVSNLGSLLQDNETLLSDCRAWITAHRRRRCRIVQTFARSVGIDDEDVGGRRGIESETRPLRIKTGRAWPRSVFDFMFGQGRRTT
jgi:hypothetical protein